MTNLLRVLLEIGPKGKRVVASAMDWPGLERWGKTEDEAVDRLLAYVPRYAPVAERVNLRSEFERASTPDITERTPGNTSTDWWGIAHVPSVSEADPLTDEELERRIAIMRATWAFFDDAAGAADTPLTKGPRGGGRERDQVVRHVYASERHNFWRKVGIRESDEVRLTPEELADLRERFIAAIREYHAEDRPARKWPLRFLIRRTAQHAMDHAWEIEDRRPWLSDRGRVP
jgi:hypothetical protein